MKIWRRGFIGDGNERFDPVYLTHPGVVTGIKWRGRPRAEEHADAVLYTTCADGYLRVWTATEPHCLHILDLWSEIDLITAIQPRSPLSPSPFKKRYAFMVDKWDFQQAVEGVEQIIYQGEREQHTCERLREIASNEPEVCIILDDQGNMSAWGLERVGCKTRFGNDVINIGHAENLETTFPVRVEAKEDFAILSAFTNDSSDGSLQILAHLFDGRLHWLTSPVEQLFDPSPRPTCIRVEAELTGHSSPIQWLTTDTSNEYTLSSSEDGEIVVWRQPRTSGATLARQSTLKCKSFCLDGGIIRGGDYAVTLHEGEVFCWDIRLLKGFQVASISLQAKSNSKLCIPERLAKDFAQINVIDEDCHATCIILNVQAGGVDMFIDSNDGGGTDDIIHNGIPDDERMTKSDCIIATDQTQCGRALCIDSRGRLEILDNSRDGWGIKQNVGIIRLGVENISAPRVVAFSSDLVAFIEADGITLTIFNLASRLCELRHRFSKHESVLAMRWTRALSGSPLLAVALAHRVIIFIPTRTYTESRSAAWRIAREIDVFDVTNVPIVDIVWTASETLVVAVGNQMFGFETSSSPEQGEFPFLEEGPTAIPHIKLSRLVRAASSILPVYAPHSVFADLLGGHFSSVCNLLQGFNERLKYFTEGDELSSTLGLIDEADYSIKRPRGLVNGYTDDQTLTNGDVHPVGVSFSVEDAQALNDRLASPQLPWLTAYEQSFLSELITSVGKLDKFANSVDNSGLHYLTSLFLHESSVFDRNTPYNPWRSTVHALLSNTQDILLDATMQLHSQNQTLPWSYARQYHTCLFLTSRDTLLAHFETIARAEYTKTDERNPLDCSLYYLALHKKQVLQGLWRMATWHRERDATMRVLAQNFDESRWRTAALKNAYALLGKRRALYAAAWFLLAEEGKSAVGVLAGDEVDDLELAIAVARVYDGDDGSILRSLIEDRLFPKAVAENNRWMAVWGALMLKREDLALNAIVAPLQDVLPNAPATLPLEATMWYNEDPSIIWTYMGMRDEVLSRPPGRRVELPSLVQEKEAVLRSVRMYMRVGCGWMALRLLRAWEFAPLPTGQTQGDHGVDTRAAGEREGGDATVDGAASMLDAFQVADEKREDEGKSAGRKKVVEEPSAASILDDFDF